MTAVRLICLTWDQIQATQVARGRELEDLTGLPRSIGGVEVGLTLHASAAVSAAKSMCCLTGTPATLMRGDLGGEHLLDQRLGWTTNLGKELVAKEAQ